MAISKNRLLLLMWMLLVVITPAFAQITAGIRGNVPDQSGGVVPDASVNLTSLETSLFKTTITDTAGIYSLRYCLSEATASPSKPKASSHIGSQISPWLLNQMLGVNVTVEVGETAQVVEVQAGHLW